jgi:hypothetical protein
MRVRLTGGGSGCASFRQPVAINTGNNTAAMKNKISRFIFLLTVDIK